MLVIQSFRIQKRACKVESQALLHLYETLFTAQNQNKDQKICKTNPSISIRIISCIVVCVTNSVTKIRRDLKKARLLFQNLGILCYGLTGVEIERVETVRNRG